VELALALCALEEDPCDLISTCHAKTWEIFVCITGVGFFLTETIFAKLASPTAIVLHDVVCSVSRFPNAGFVKTPLAFLATDRSRVSPYTLPASSAFSAVSVSTLCCI